MRSSTETPENTQKLQQAENVLNEFYDTEQMYRSNMKMIAETLAQYIKEDKTLSSAQKKELQAYRDVYQQLIQNPFPKPAYLTDQSMPLRERVEKASNELDRLFRQNREAIIASTYPGVKLVDSGIGARLGKNSDLNEKKLLSIKNDILAKTTDVSALQKSKLQLLTMDSFTIAVVQRLPKYPLLLRDLSKSGALSTTEQTKIDNLIPFVSRTISLFGSNEIDKRFCDYIMVNNDITKRLSALRDQRDVSPAMQHHLNHLISRLPKIGEQFDRDSSGKHLLSNVVATIAELKKECEARMLVSSISTADKKWLKKTVWEELNKYEKTIPLLVLKEHVSTLADKQYDPLKKLLDEIDINHPEKINLRRLKDNLLKIQLDPKLNSEEIKDNKTQPKKHQALLSEVALALSRIDETMVIAKQDSAAIVRQAAPATSTVAIAVALARPEPVSDRSELSTRSNHSQSSGQAPTAKLERKKTKQEMQMHQLFQHSQATALGKTLKQKSSEQKEKVPEQDIPLPRKKI